MTAPLKTIRQVAEELDVSLRWLRFYEEKQLVKPQRQGNRRLYYTTDVARLRKIRRLSDCGVAVRDMALCLDGTPAERAAVLEATAAMQSKLLAELTARQAALEAFVIEQSTPEASS